MTAVNRRGSRLTSSLGDQMRTRSDVRLGLPPNPVATFTRLYPACPSKYCGLPPILSVCTAVLARVRERGVDCACRRVHQALGEHLLIETCGCLCPR